jgi:4-hydroxy-tetrahydrodipicolinate synthase
MQLHWHFFMDRRLKTMTKNIIFEGAATALVTPTTEKGVDYEALGKLIDWQIDEGIDALVICGTTGESSTLSDEEHREVLRYSLERAAGRVPMIAGTGSNDTDYAISLTKYASELGYSGALVVTPYYNKTTQKGLVAHFTAIADASSIPLILYNVPSRTGVNIEPATYAALADHPMIGGIKEASGNISKIVETATLVGDKVAIYSGNDDEIVPIIACGGKGVISVLSNVAPKETSLLCRKALDGDMPGAMALQAKYLKLIRALFSEVNPIPAKAAMSALGFCENYLRLPLVPMEKAHEDVLLERMKEVGIHG